MCDIIAASINLKAGVSPMKNVILSAILALIGGIASTASAQQLPGAHPSYLHALSDLRAARWFLYHQPGDAKVYGDEDVGIREIDAAIGEMKRAAIDAALGDGYPTRKSGGPDRY
jgi:hypothetical protein